MFWSAKGIPRMVGGSFSNKRCRLYGETVETAWRDRRDRAVLV